MHADKPNAHANLMVFVLKLIISMIIIGIAGGTGSGKTTVVKKIVESLPENSVAVIPQDSYYNDQSDMPLEERKKTNFDHPDAFEWTLLASQINDLREGRSIEQPTYSYLTCTRLPETIHVEPKEVIIVEGIMALYDKHLRDLMDIKIFVDAAIVIAMLRSAPYLSCALANIAVRSEAGLYAFASAFHLARSLSASGVQVHALRWMFSPAGPRPANSESERTESPKTKNFLLMISAPSFQVNGKIHPSHRDSRC